MNNKTEKNNNQTHLCHTPNTLRPNPVPLRPKLHPTLRPKLQLGTLYKIFLLLILLPLVAVSILSGCSGDKNVGSTVDPKEGLRRRTVDNTGIINASTFSADAVVSIKAMNEDGSLSQPYAPVKEFTEKSFFQGNMTTELLDKRGFVLEFRDKELLTKCIWEFRNGYNNSGLVDESSTFITENVLELMKGETTQHDLTFFLKYFNDVNLENHLDPDNAEHNSEVARAMREMFRLWTVPPDDLVLPDFKWGAFEHSKFRGERKLLFTKAIAFMYLLNMDKGNDYRQWLPPFFKAFSELFLEEAQGALLGYEPEIDHVKNCSAHSFSIRDALVATYLPEDAEPPASIIEPIDDKYRTDMLADLDYDLSRRMIYLRKTGKRIIGYNTKNTPEENLRILFETFNSTLETTRIPQESLDRARIDVVQLPAFSKAVEEAVEKWALELKFQDVMQRPAEEDEPEAEAAPETDAEAEPEEAQVDTPSGEQ